MSISVSIGFLQLKAAVEQCGIDEKLELLQLLEKETFPMRFKKFLDQVKNDDLSLEDITEEVESVRQTRYKAR